MRYRVLPYRQGSRSAKALAEALKGKVLKLEGSSFSPKASDVIINWGNTSFNDQAHWGDGYHLINDGDLIHCASNKLTFFEYVKAIHPDIIPPFWTSQAAIPADAYPVVCRTTLAGHSGDGIVIAQIPSEVVAAPLYVKYIKKKEEYRIHLGKTGEGVQTIAVQRKVRDPARAVTDWKVRSHQNGFLFQRQNLSVPGSVLAVARQAFLCSSLDFGAVDAVFNEQSGRAFVLEINTAPGLEGQTIEDYAQFFRSLT